MIYTKEFILILVFFIFQCYNAFSDETSNIQKYQECLANTGKFSFLLNKTLENRDRQTAQIIYEHAVDECAFFEALIHVDNVESEINLVEEVKTIFHKAVEETLKKLNKECQIKCRI